MTRPQPPRWTCSNCQHWLAEHEDFIERPMSKGYGTCRRYAPFASASNSNVCNHNLPWHMTNANDWCSEHMPRQHPRRFGPIHPGIEQTP